MVRVRLAKVSSESVAQTRTIECDCIDSQSEDGCPDSASTSSNSSSTQSHSGTDSSGPTNQICCLKQRFGSVFNSEQFSDVAFIVGEGEKKQRFPGHKLVLAVGSAVFKAMFSKNWSNESAKIEVPDIEPSAFQALLRFLYTDEVLLTSDNVIAVLYAARKYDVRPLENFCVDFLIQDLCPKNAFAVLNDARLLDIHKLITSCLEAIDEDTVEAVSSDDFCDANIGTLCLVLDRDSLTISEIKLFQAILRWSEAECLRKDLPVSKENQQSVVKEVLPLIRFPLIPVEEFSAYVTESGLLSKDELLSMYMYLTKKPKPSVNFKDKCRVFSGKELVVNRFNKPQFGKFTSTGERWNKIDFTCNIGLELLGYGLHGSTIGAAEYNVKLELWDTLADVSLRSESADFVTDGSYRALFKDPIQLSAHKKYSACVYVKGPECFTGAGGMDKVTMDLLHGRQITVKFSTNAKAEETFITTVDKGFIPRLIFRA